MNKYDEVLDYLIQSGKLYLNEETNTCHYKNKMSKTEKFIEEKIKNEQLPQKQLYVSQSTSLSLQ